MSRRQERRVLTVSFLLPAILLYTLFVLYPGYGAFRISLREWNGLSPELGKFVGLRNFTRMATDELVQKAVSNNIFLLLVPTVLIIVLALFFAEMINKGVRGASFFQIVFFFPNTLSMVIVGLIWLFVYCPTFGLLNGLLRAIGLGGLARPWLGVPGLVIPAIAAALVWMKAGYHMVLFLTAMKNIPKDLYECAELDGANAWQRFWNMTLPLIWDSVRVSMSLLVLTAIQQFALVWVMTEGGPSSASEVMGTFMYKSAFRWLEVGYGNAVAVVMFIFVFLLSLISFGLTRREAVEF